MNSIKVTGLRLASGLVCLDNDDGIDAYPDWAYSTKEKAEQAKENLS